LHSIFNSQLNLDSAANDVAESELPKSPAAVAAVAIREGIEIEQLQ
jgi:hypothetical protein